MSASEMHAPADAGLQRSEVEAMIEDSVQRIFGDEVSPALIDSAEAGNWPAVLWETLIDGGLPMALCSAEAGGIDAQWSDIFPILHGIGYWSVPLPLAETMIAAGLLDQAGVKAPHGPIAIAAASASLSLSKSHGDGSPALSGVLHSVPWGRQRSWLLAAIPSLDDSNDLGLVDLSSPSIEVRPGANVAGEPRDDLHFHETTVFARFSNPIPTFEDPLLYFGALARCAMLTGALERGLALTIQYANDRVQFGKPLAKYQVIQQELAAAAGMVIAAKVATRVAFASMHPELKASTSAFDIAVAKVRCGRAATRLPVVAHQIHGAIGFTFEHVLHRTTRRLWAWRQEFGGDAAWAAVLGRAAIARGGADFWTSLCDRRLGDDIRPAGQ